MERNGSKEGGWSQGAEGGGGEMRRGRAGRGVTPKDTLSGKDNLGEWSSGVREACRAGWPPWNPQIAWLFREPSLACPSSLVVLLGSALPTGHLKRIQCKPSSPGDR